MRRLVLFIIIAMLIIGSALYSLKLNSQHASYPMMGTKVNFTVKDRNAPAHINAALSRMREIERALNRYDPKSAVSLLNRGEGSSHSIDLVRCLRLAEKVKELTRGAFNARYSGKVNLDGIGKGYAVEEARKLLFKRGVKNAMIDMGSSIAIIGGPYKIAIKHPRKNGEYLEVFTAGGIDAVSTSGDYEQGKHLIDPATMKPSLGCQAVTVVTDDAGMADGLSTGIFVMGPQKGLALARKLGIKVLIVGWDGEIYSNKL